jgi:hypothetical protein
MYKSIITTWTSTALKTIRSLGKLANCAADAIAQLHKQVTTHTSAFVLVAKLLQKSILISLFSFVNNTSCMPTFTNDPNL